MERWVFMFEVTVGAILFIAIVYHIGKEIRDICKSKEHDEHEKESIG